MSGLIRKIILGVFVVLLIAVGFLVFNKSEGDIDRSIYQWEGMVYKNIDEYLRYFNLDEEAVDYDSFNVLSDGLAYDNNFIYYRNQAYAYDEMNDIQKYKKLQLAGLKNSFTGPNIDEWDPDTFQVLSLTAGVFRDKNNVYYAGYKKNISTEKIQVLGGLIYTDGQKTYSGIDAVLKLDPQKIEFIGAYVTDGKRVYKRGSALLGYIEVFDINPKEIIPVNDYFSKDSKRYYFANQEIEGIDYDSFKVFQYHAVDKNKAYFFLNPYFIVDIEGIDFESFEELGRFEARDKNHFYYKGKAVDNVDVASITENPYGVFYDKNSVLMEGKAIEGIDPLSYRYDPSSKYGIDDKFIYFQHLKIPESESAEFNLLGRDKVGNSLSDSYAEDSNNVYFNNLVIEGATPGEFQYIGNGFFKSNESIFFKNKVVPEIDYETFEIMDNYLSRDKNSLIRIRADHFVISQTVQDPYTFRYVGGDHFYRDDHNVYLLHIQNRDFVLVEGVDANKLELLTYRYFKDDQKIYHVDFYDSLFVVVDADYASFKVDRKNRSMDAKDKSACFYEGKRLEQCP